MKEGSAVQFRHEAGTIARDGHRPAGHIVVQLRGVPYRVNIRQVRRTVRVRRNGDLVYGVEVNGRYQEIGERHLERAE